MILRWFGFPIMHQVHAKHKVHNCHHIKKLFHVSNNILGRITIQSLYTSLQFFICNTRVAMARVALCVILCAVYCLLAIVLLRVPPLKFPSHYLPSSHAPPLLLSLAPLPPPSPGRFLPPLFPSLRPCMCSFLTRSRPQPSIPSSTPAPTLPHVIASSLPPLVPSLPTLPLLPPAHTPSFLAPSLLPSLPACLRPSNSMSNVCVFDKLH